MSPLAVYVHIPFCPSKCGYCDFNSFALSGEIMERTTQAIIHEIEQSPAAGRPAKTIFFGGGTPTYIPVEQLLAILDTVVRVHPPLEDAEITSEANPGTVDSEKFAAMRRGGFNRISLGAQSFLNEDLIRLGRIHRNNEINRAVAAARTAGFDNLNLDMMFALPGQSQTSWMRNLREALDLQPDHLSLYCLTIEPNTPFYRQALKGELIQPDDDEQVAMYEMCSLVCQEAGLEQYEISNYAKPGRECKHNLCYWLGEEYAGYGPGAVGRLGETRATKIKHPERYCEAVESGSSLTCDSEALGVDDLRVEAIMLGLRLTSGIPSDGIEIDEPNRRRMVAKGWLVDDPSRLQLTLEGRHFCSEVAVELA